MNKKELIEMCEKLYENKAYATWSDKKGQWAITVETYDADNNRMAIIFESYKGNLACFVDGPRDERNGDLFVHFYGDTEKVFGE